MMLNNNDKQELFEMLLYELQQNEIHQYEYEIIVKQEELKGILETIDILVELSFQERKDFLRNLSKKYENKINYILNKKVKFGKVTKLERDLLHLLMEDYIITRFEPPND